MSDAADRLAQALCDLIKEAVEEAITQGRPPASAQVALPLRPQDDLGLCPSCGKNQARRLLTVAEARQQLGGISPTTFYALIKQRELSLVKIGRRSFVDAQEIEEFLQRKRYADSG